MNERSPAWERVLERLLAGSRWLLAPLSDRISGDIKLKMREAPPGEEATKA